MIVFRYTIPKNHHFNYLLLLMPDRISNTYKNDSFIKFFSSAAFADAWLDKSPLHRILAFEDTFALLL